MEMAKEVLPAADRATRFETGLQHFVFEVTSAQGQSVVVRASRRSDQTIACDAVYWSDLLRPLGVPLPAILHADMSRAHHPFPFVILERVAGRDLGEVIDGLSPAPLRQIAERLIGIQAATATLGEGQGYGFTPRMDGPFPNKSWDKTIAASLAGSRERIRQAAIVEECHTDRLLAVSERLAAYFETVRPIPFLHDITTKNVLIDAGHLTGIVDVDNLCFGDPLFLLGLIRTALLAHNHPPTYADIWIDILSPEPEETAALDFYTALFCLDFLSEIGHRFNRAEPVQADKDRIARLLGALDQHL